MITPSPRGFPATSATDRICEHVRTNDRPARRPLTARWKAEAEKDGTALAAFDLCTAFGLAPLLEAAPAKPRPVLHKTATGSTATEERTFWIPFSPPVFHVKKDGTTAEKKMKVTLTTITVSIKTGDAAPVAVFRASNRGSTVLDLRTEKRVPLCEVNRELMRWLGDDAAPITAALGALQPDRPAKVKPKAAPRPLTGTPECLSKWVRRPSAEVAPLTDKQIEALSDEDFAARLHGTFYAMDVITRAGTPEFYGN